MRIITIKLDTAKTYPEFFAVVYSNSFGDQVIEYWQENVNGRQLKLAVVLNQENSRMTDDEIKNEFNLIGIETA